MKTKYIQIVLIILYFQNSQVLNAQTTFKTLTERSQSLGIVILQMESSYLIAEYGHWSGILKFDTLGSLIYLKAFKSLHYSFTFGNVGSKNFLLNAGNGNVITCMLGQNKQYYVSLASFNHNSKTINWINGFNIIDTALYLWTGTNFPITLNYANNNGYLISTYKRVDSLFSQRLPLIVSTDSTGNLLNSYRINEHYGVSVFTHQANNNSYIAGINFTNDTIGASLLRFDTSGQVIWAKTFFNKKSIFYSSVNNNDGTITILGCPDTTFDGTLKGGTLLKQWFIIKVDTIGNVLWCKLYGDSLRSFRNSVPGQIKLTNDGGYILTGYTCDTSVTWLNGSDLIIVKINANGDTLWTRTHGNAYTEDGGQDITQTADGGYIVCGYSSSDQFFYGGYLVIKTDSLGMTASHCQEFSTPMAVSSIVPPDSNISLTITTGLISSMPSSVGDTTYTVPQKNGCWLSATGLEENVHSPRNAYSIVPNPTQGIFTLKNKEYHQGSVTIFIYDILGHEILTETNINDAEPQLDLTSHPPGMYYIKVIQGSNIEVVKVVVQ